MAARRAKTSSSTRVSNRDRRLGPWFRLLADIETGRDEPEPYKLLPPDADFHDRAHGRSDVRQPGDAPTE